ncbi:MAG: hypothetical protein L6Q40_05180 [Azonexus sp.]|nr:hypothetical protein [Azonexus sp.]
MRRLLLLLLAVTLSACSTRLGRDGRSETTVDAKYLLKTEVDRITDANRAEVVDGLLLIADKLYKRNPREWKKAGQLSREAAVARLRDRVRHNWPELGSLRSRQAAALAFAEAYSGDRVAALMFGLLTMVDIAFEHKTEFYMLDSLNEINLFNTARNMEVAIWKLGHDRNPAGEWYLLSNELDPANRNLSFEREFGRITGLLDFMARIVADRNGRTLSRLSQSVATAIFLPVGL